MGLFGKKQKSKVREQEIKPTGNIVSTKVHVSGYIFREDEEIISENRVMSPRGEGWLLITSAGVFFILDSEGIYMNLKHEFIQSVMVETNNKISISWIEDSGSFDYQFRIKEGEQEAKRIVNLANETFHYVGSSVQHIELSESDVEETRNEYKNRFQRIIESNQQTIVHLEPKLDEIKNEDPDKQQKKLELFTEINKAKDNISVYQKNLEHIDTMSITRSYKIPANIPNGNVWNDCYYNESKKAFVTFNKTYIEFSKEKPREIQSQFESEMGVNAGVIIPEDGITFRFGYPVLANKDQDGKHVWSILCTLTDEMLTEEIILARLNPKSHEESAIYDTVSEQWLGGDLKMCEKEYEIGHKNNLWRCTESLPEKIKWQKQLNASISND